MHLFDPKLLLIISMNEWLIVSLSQREWHSAKTQNRIRSKLFLSKCLLYLSRTYFACIVLVTIEICWPWVIFIHNFGQLKLNLEEVKTFRPAVSEGLNPTVHILKSGSRPRGHYLFTLGLNPSGYYYTFWVRTQSLLFIKSGSEPNGLEIVFWVQTQRSIFINSGSEPRCSKIRFWVYTQRSLFRNCGSEPRCS